MEDRRMAVLRAIVEEYVNTHEPVGSKVLADRHSLGVSSATIRNDMATLEEEGLIHAPHTSAGRIPTEKGYRLFVDRLSAVRPLSTAERSAMQSFLDKSMDLDDIMHRTVRLLAQLTRQVAIVQYPSLGRSTVRHVELVLLAPTRIMLVVIADTGRVEQRIVETSNPLNDEDLASLRSVINSAVVGRHIPDVAEDLAIRVAALPREATASAAAVTAALLEVVLDPRDDRVVVGGTSALARVGDDFSTSMAPVLEALEEHVVLLRLIGEATRPEQVTVRIGSENQAPELQMSSLVSVGYGAGETALASLAVLGPTRMDYSDSMSKVLAVARYVGQIVMEQ